MDAAHKLPNVEPKPAADPAQPALELIPPSTPNPDRPAEQLLLLRTLEVVRDRVESPHAVQHYVAERLKDIRANLPVQRRALSKRTMELHILAVSSRRNGLCPCCQTEPVCTPSGRLPGAEFDHWLSRAKSAPNSTWLVCGECNQRLLNADFKAEAAASFHSYQAALKPLLNRQVPLALTAAAKGE